MLESLQNVEIKLDRFEIRDSIFQMLSFAGLAQLVERFTCNEDVRGSNPLTCTSNTSFESRWRNFGRRARGLGISLYPED
jgi:hypothetical protein